MGRSKKQVKKQTKKSKSKSKTKGQNGGFKTGRRYRKTPKDTTQRRRKKINKK